MYKIKKIYSSKLISIQIIFLDVFILNEETIHPHKHYKFFLEIIIINIGFI
jgi:hypothetical protein